MQRFRNTKRQPTTDALEIIYRRYYEGHPDRIARYEEVKADDEVARKIYHLRTRAKLTQRALAKLVGTTASVICRLEDADYEGHSLAMLNRIAEALGKRVEINFVALPKSATIPKPAKKSVTSRKSSSVPSRKRTAPSL